MSIISAIGILFFRRKIRVLAYHKVPDIRSFQEQVKYLKSNFNIISLEDLIDAFYHGKKLNPKSLLITFDDGDYSVYENALPILKEENINAVLFIITKLINSNQTFWWDELEYYLGENKGNEITWKLKDLPNIERENFLSELRDKSEKPSLRVKQLKSEELQIMNKSNLQIANHSHTHPMFDKCSVAELEKEMDQSMSFLKDLNLYSDVFAYPNGNLDLTSEKVLQNQGIKLAFLFDHKLANLYNPLRISRIRVDASLPIHEFKAKVSGLHSIIYHRSIKV
ncbi:polysaccharide deacetylase family protein [Christiangramia sp. SM2212]|uniref:Polysaccharide deacetylase family protein n=1 Tax=Christiangramia sediminicola TaxID=3073267 RepID=A0ABU1EQY4_9FLAO|nr:polysaccharide deacetylase family protein [Christiangramia sp. SM2212]MDR5590573.1 polysaccharide deacetylase family protein [Christiangramia sp. SM2212]